MLATKATCGICKHERARVLADAGVSIAYFRKREIVFPSDGDGSRRIQPLPFLDFRIFDVERILKKRVEGILGESILCR